MPTKYERLRQILCENLSDKIAHLTESKFGLGLPAIDTSGVTGWRTAWGDTMQGSIKN